MMNTLLGVKIKQTQYFTDDGKRIPVTHIQAGPCWVTQVTDRGNFQSIQLGFGMNKKSTKSRIGHMKKAGLEQKPLFLREIRAKKDETITLGSEVKVSDVFSVGDKIRVTGTSKGKGFAGVVKRHHFKGGPRTHGQSDRERAPGSIGQTTTPGRVYRGKRMAGRMGTERVTVRGLQVVSIDANTNMLTIKGLVPGVPQGLLFVSKEV